MQAILDKYIIKEPKITQEYIYTLENKFIDRFKTQGHNQFSCPEFENIFACLYDILIYYKTSFLEKNTNDFSLIWQINQSIELIKNCSQQTICLTTKKEQCPEPSNNIEQLGYYNLTPTSSCKDNVYESPYDGKEYPYAYCIRVISRIMHVIDAIHLYESSNTMDEISKKDFYNSPYAYLYFRNNFEYYLDYLLLNAPNVFILPVLQFIGATQLINIRSSRIQICGVVFDKIFVDEFYQSPGNFFWHDINHSRKIYQNNVFYAKRNGISIDKLYEMMKIDTAKIMPIGKWLNEENKHLITIIKILLFEILHEDAYPFLLEEIVKDIVSKSGECYPYEKKIINDTKPYQRLNIRFYAQRGTTMNTLYNKITHKFFENDTPDDIIVKKELRNISDLAKGTLVLLNKIFSLSPELKISISIDNIKELIAFKKFKFMSNNVEELPKLNKNNVYNVLSNKLNLTYIPKYIKKKGNTVSSINQSSSKLVLPIQERYGGKRKMIKTKKNKHCKKSQTHKR